MGLRHWVRSLERDARESGEHAYIAQAVGPPVKVSGEEWLEAFDVEVRRMTGEDVPAHPLAEVAANSPDPAWHNSLLSGCFNSGEREDTSE